MKSLCASCVPSPSSGLKKAERLAGLESREDIAQVLLSEMTAHEFAQHIAIIGGDGEIAALEELFLFEAGPLSVNFAALDRTAGHHHEAAMAVIRSAVAVLGSRSAKFRHRHQDDVLH